MLKPSALGGARHIAGLNDLLFAREMLPEVGDAESPIGAFEGGPDAGLVIDVSLHYFGALRGEGNCLFRRRIPREGAHGEAAVGVAQDRSGQTAALSPRGSNDRD